LHRDLEQSAIHPSAHGSAEGVDIISTAKYRPWSVDVVIEFPDESRAVAFERYLKSGSR